METKLLTPLILGVNADSKELSVRTEYEVINFDESRRWFFKIAGATLFLGTTLTLIPKKVNANMLVIGGLIISGLTLLLGIAEFYDWNQNDTKPICNIEAVTINGDVYIIKFEVPSGEVARKLPLISDEISGDMAQRTLEIINETYPYEIEATKK